MDRRSSIYRAASPSIRDRNRTYRLANIAISRADELGTALITLLRSLDPQGRIFLPKEDIRKAQEGDRLDIFVDDVGNITLRVLNPDLDAQVAAFKEEQDADSRAAAIVAA